MDYSELMLAVKVRKIATELHAAAQAEFKKTTNIGADLIMWNAKNPVMNFVPEAIDQLKQIADIIRQS